MFLCNNMRYSEKVIFFLLIMKWLDYLSMFSYKQKFFLV